MDGYEKFKELAGVFETGKKYTLYRMGGMANTVKQEIEVVRFSLDDDGPVFRRKRERKLFVLKLWSRAYQSAPLKPFDAAVFEGWDQPVKCDTETNFWRGNACYNFIGTPEVVRAWMDAGQRNPYFDKARTVVCEDRNGEPALSGETVVYPELYKGGCAPIDRYLEKMEQTAEGK